MSNKGSWFETGYAGAAKEEKRRSMGFPPDRHWMKDGSSRQIVFVSDDPFCLKEHGWKNSNDDWHHATCLANINDNGCPACGATGVSRADYIGHYAIVDVTGYKTKEGDEVKNQLKLLPAKTKVLNKFKLKKDNRGSLTGQLWTITRADKNAPNTGDDLDHVREIDVDKLFEAVLYKGKSLAEMIRKANGSGSDSEKTRDYLAHHFQIPASGPIPLKIPSFNFPNLMAPMEYSVLKTLVADAVPYGGTKKADAVSSFSGDDVPF